MKQLMTGNEAIARGAYEAGVHFASAYPGTPSTEILENISTYKEIYSEWAPNEKVALEAAVGASIAGGRAICSMKHVGINVAADPLFTYAYIEANGGLVLVTADEPGQHSSQNEQDNRNYAKFAKIPMFEPSDSQECIDFLKMAFEVSERFKTVVLFRVTTRVCHSKCIVETSPRKETPILSYERNIPRNITIPAFSRVMRLKVEKKLEALTAYAENTKINKMEFLGGKVGVITSGLSYYYAKEAFPEDTSFLKLGFTYPLPEKKIKEFCSKFETLYVVEENDPILEEYIKTLGFTVHGRDTFPFCGELTQDVLRKSLTGKTLPTIEYKKEDISPRPPTLCAGCPHRGMFYELGKLKNVAIAGDIGCYTLGFAEPYNAMDYNLCMGGSFSSGHGMQKIFDMGDSGKRVISVLGDSTFFHTGINSLLEVVYNNSNTVNIILDNRITGMTGHQENPGTGYNAMGDSSEHVDIEGMVKACGVKHIKVIDPNNLSEVKKTLEWALGLNEPSVIITRWPCVLKKFSNQDKKEFPSAFKQKCVVTEKCVGCKMCIKSGCPAISFDNKAKKSVIDKVQCVGCEICMQICPVKAIVKN